MVDVETFYKHNLYCISPIKREKNTCIWGNCSHKQWSSTIWDIKVNSYMLHLQAYSSLNMAWIPSVHSYITFTPKSYLKLKVIEELMGWQSGHIYHDKAAIGQKGRSLFSPYWPHTFVCPMMHGNDLSISYYGCTGNDLDV